MKILIADDEPVSRRALRVTLEGWGYEVVEAANGDESLAALSAAGAPTLAILDWMMPAIDGLEVCRRIRERGREPYVYIVLLTARADHQDLITGLEAGADEYLVKPYDPLELRARLRAGQRILDLQEELVGAREAIRAQASKDSLTGVLTRCAVLDALNREIARASRLGGSLALVLGDLDHFKEINDRYGHLAGDAVLRESGRRMRRSLRPYDPIGRYGGEEFLIALPSCDRPTALEVAERLRATIGATPFRLPEGPLNVTISLGIAVLAGRAGGSSEALIHAADAALYAAKAAGRNASVLAPEGAPLRGIEPPETTSGGSRSARAGSFHPDDPRGAPVDLDRLQEICQNDQALRDELLDLFASSTAPRLPSLRSAVQAGDAEVVEGEAHAIKGASSHLGAGHLEDLAMQLERASRDGDLRRAPDLVRQLEVEFDRVRSFLEALPKTGSPER